MWNNFVIILSLICGVYLYYFTDTSDKISFLDIGQGDCALIEVGGLKILIDTGFDMNSIWAIDENISLNDRKIDIIILTHPHFDHYGSINQVLSRYEVGEIWITYGCEFPYLKGLAERYGVDIVGVYRGFVFEFNGLNMEILSPEKDVEGNKCGDTNKANNESLVIELSYRHKKFLFMGDAEKDVEYEISNSVEDVDVLKVGHHCSDTSSKIAFIEMVNPEISICSYGEGNSYGHPSNSVVKRLEDVGSEVWETAVDGSYIYYFE